VSHEVSSTTCLSICIGLKEKASENV
jgi:hypothetical protein